MNSEADQTEAAVAPMDGSSEGTGPDTNQAMSGADAQSQQTGGETAAKIAKEASPDHSSSLNQAMMKARAALDAGDEAGCLDALKGVS